MIEGKTIPITFIGIADHVNAIGPPFPVGPIDLFQLSQHKTHIIYPAFTTKNEYIFLLQKEVFETEKLRKLRIRIVDEENVELGHINMTSTSEPVKYSDIDKITKDSSHDAILVGAPSFLFHVKIDSIVCHPGKYIVEASFGEEFQEIGEVYFHYRPTPPLTLDQIKAIESDPRSIIAIRIDLGCKHCPTKQRIYTALEKLSSFEKEGCTWHQELKNNFMCNCGKSKYSLKYIKESLHGLLLKNLSSDLTGLSYERCYAHGQIMDVVKNYESKLKAEKDEKPFQEYIEKHPVLLAHFHAKRLWFKASILGKFETDFALLDTRNQLILIELEKPSMKLFKRDGHPTADLMHAYGQVRDWLHEYSKHPSAVIDGLKLGDEKIMAVRGVVIAGRRSKEIIEPLQRHLSSPIYPDIDFLTLDDLSLSLCEISRKLA